MLKEFDTDEFDDKSTLKSIHSEINHLFFSLLCHFLYIFAPISNIEKPF